MLAIQQMMKEGYDSLSSSIKELELTGYLLRIKYRDKKTKQWSGSFWAYTDFPGKFNLSERIESLDSKGFEVIVPEGDMLDLPDPGNPLLGMPGPEKPMRTILTSNNTEEEEKIHKTSAADLSPIDKPITMDLFESFCKIYPRLVDKGKTFTAWRKICNKPANERPTWRIIKKAIIGQKKSERWQDPEYIPLSATWLNQSRWMDDPAQMKLFKEKVPKKENPEDIIKIESKGNNEQDLLEIYKDLQSSISNSNGDAGKIAAGLCHIVKWYDKKQDRPKFKGVPEYGDDLYHAYNNWELVPYPVDLVKKYIRWLRSENWIEDIVPAYFDPEGKMFTKFLHNYQNEIGVDFFDGHGIH